MINRISGREFWSTNLIYKSQKSAWASCQCDAEFINGIADLEAEWNPKHHIRGGFGTRSRISKRFQLFQYHSI